MMDYVGVLINRNKREEALAMLERELTMKIQDKTGNVDSLVLAILCMYIIKDDLETAEKKLEEFASDVKGFIKTPEFECAEKMINAYINGDQQEFSKQAQRNIVNHVYPANIIKLLRNTKVNPRMDKKTVNLAELLGSGDTGNHETQNPENVKKALDNLIC